MVWKACECWSLPVAVVVVGTSPPVAVVVAV
jgi:hypothetical protein